MDQDLLPEGMTFRRWAATSANTRRRKSTGLKRSVALGRQLPGAVNMKPGTASSTYSRRLRWSQLTLHDPIIPAHRMVDRGIWVPGVGTGLAADTHLRRVYQGREARDFARADDARIVGIGLRILAVKRNQRRLRLRHKSFGHGLVHIGIAR